MSEPLVPSAVDVEEQDDDSASNLDYVPSSESSSDEEDNDPGTASDEEEGQAENDGQLQDFIDSFPAKMKEMLDRIATKGMDQSPELQAHFVSSYHAYLQPQDKAVQDAVAMDDRNILYRMARDNVQSAWLTKYLVEKCPQLLYETDEFDNGTLLVAITRDRRDFIKTVLESNIGDKHIQEALASCGSKKENCIHVAVAKVPKCLDPELVVGLIERASEVILAAQDEKGYTPLHRAVEYSRCTALQLKVVRALIKRGDSAFDCRTNKPDQFSVYRCHVDSRQKYEARRVEKKQPKPSKVPGTKDTVSLQGRKKPEAGVPQSKAPGDKDRVGPDVGQKAKVDDRLWSDWENVQGVGRPHDPKGARLEEALMLAAPQKLRRAPTIAPQNELTSTLTSPIIRAAPPLGGYTPNDFRPIPGPEVTHRSDSPMAPVSRSSPAGAEVLQAPSSAVRTKRPKLTKTAGKSSKSIRDVAEVPSAECADIIARELKLHYLRATFNHEGETNMKDEAMTPRVAKLQVPERRGIRTHNCAIKFLFGDNQEDNNICFDFPPTQSGEADKINFKHFEESYARLKFDNVLRYVDFLRVELEAAQPRPRPSEASPDLGAGRRDMVPFFEWLGKKGVKTIIKVVVDDRSTTGLPHSDDAIETALRKFEIEILDWRKFDMDPSAICEACRGSTNLRELHLWWSGNNAILRAWSEPDGLTRLKTLKRIVLHQETKGLESRSRTEQNIQEFQERLRKYSQITVDYDRFEERRKLKLKGRVPTKDLEGKSQIDTHRWLTIMDTFAECIYNLRDPAGFQAELADEKIPSELQRDVRVALLDDGANFMHKAIRGVLENGRSFDGGGYDGPDASGSPGPFHGSTTGHGTCMAYMISRVCPKVKIFVCKMNVIRPGSQGKKAKFTAKSAAEAVEFAVNRGFDIISMSWTVQSLDDDTGNTAPDIARLQAALERAVKAKILIFCSAPDIGAASQSVLGTYYPFGCTSISDSIFKIGAAKADGSMYSWAGSPETVDFILPGHNVAPREGDQIHEEGDIPKTGSSVATALAAGLAALIIHCVRLGAMYNWHRRRVNDGNAVNEDSVRAIKRYSAMKEALVRISSGYTEKDRRLEVENFFRDPSKVLDPYNGGSDEDRWEKIAQMARDLVSSSTQAKVAHM